MTAEDFLFLGGESAFGAYALGLLDLGEEPVTLEGASALGPRGPGLASGGHGDQRYSGILVTMDCLILVHA